MPKQTADAASRAGAPHALIIGGSMAGLFCGMLLRARGWNVDIYERAEEQLASRGAGIATHDELYRAFEAAGVDLRAEMGVRSEGRIVFDAAGKVLGECAMPQIMTSWGFVYRFLRSKFPDANYHGGHALERLSQTADGVTAHFADGRMAHGDWLIGADGTRSAVRQAVLPQVTLDYCGYFLWRGLIDEARIEPAVLAGIAHRLVFSAASAGHWLGYLVAGPNDDLTPSRRWYNWGWYRRGDAEELRDHLTDASGRHYPLGIPHDCIRPELVAAMRGLAARELAPPVQSVIAATPQPFLQAIYEASSPRLVQRRVILIGDAAFTARPHVGLGVSKAAVDATTLAAALAAPDQAGALAAWEQERLQYGRAAVRWGQELGSYIKAPADTPEYREKAAHYARPEVLMTVTAASEPSRYLELEKPGGGRREAGGAET